MIIFLKRISEIFVVQFEYQFQPKAQTHGYTEGTSTLGHSQDL